MSYRKYTTDALVLRSSVQGEHNRFFWLYTRELGLVHATAQSIRKEKSKLRYALQDYTYSSVSLVRGKSGWRITGASAYWSVWSSLQESTEKLAVALNLISLLHRLIRGQETDEELFDSVMSVLESLRQDNLESEELGGLELVAVLRILDLLGYLGTGELEEKARGMWENREWKEAGTKRKPFVKAINTSLRSTHL